ncbi:ABC transporter permease [bacterium]|nr:ABC transporter permease [bacterium]
MTARVWFNPDPDPKWSTDPGLVAILTTLMGLMVIGLSIAREREIGTFNQLLVSLLSPSEILIGKSVPALVIGIAESTGMILVSVFVFGVPFRGSILLLCFSMVIYLAAIIGIGLLFPVWPRRANKRIFTLSCSWCQRFFFRDSPVPFKTCPMGFKW